MALRNIDRMCLHELHSTDYGLLEQTFEQMQHSQPNRVHLSKKDGLKGLVSCMPPPERRALTLIDPSYEIKSDYHAVPEALLKAHRRFSTGVFVLWYQVVNREQTEAICSDI
jgi:23S rRNA (adenine2030-N6)-methyltransferase